MNIGKSRHLSLGGLALAVLVTTFLFAFKKADLWTTGFADPQAHYGVYQTARLIMVVFYFWLFYSTGRILLEWRSVPSPLNHLSCAFTGAMIWSLFTFALAVVQLLYLPIVVGAIFVVALRSPTLPEWPVFKIKTWRFFPVLAIASITAWALPLAAYLFLTRGFAPDSYADDALGHYFPFFSDIVKHGGLYATPWFVQFFYSKGNALFYLANLLGDPQSTQIISFVMLTLLCGLTFQFLRRDLKVSRILSLLAIGVLLTTKIMDLEFQKNHAILVSFFVYMLVQSYRFFLQREASGLRFFELVMAVICVHLISPPISVFCVAWMGALFVLTRTFNAEQSVKPLFHLAFVVLFTTGGTLLYNFLLTGFVELSPPQIALKLVNVKLVQRWADPTAIYMMLNWVIEQMRDWSTANAHFAWRDILLTVLSEDRVFSMVMWIPATLLAILLTGIIAHLTVGSNSKMKSSLPFLWLALAVILFSCLLRVTIGGSIVRLTLFCSWLEVVSLMVLFEIVLERIGNANIQKTLLTGILSFAAFYGFQFFQKKPVQIAQALRFLGGQTTYADFYQPIFKTVDAVALERFIPPDLKVDLLSYLPGFMVIPQSPFNRVDGPRYIKDFSKVIFEEPEIAATALRANQVEFALIDMSSPVTYNAFAPIYSPESLAKLYSLVRHWKTETQDYFLFRLRKTEPGLAPERDAYSADQDEFVVRWEEKLKNEREQLIYKPYVATRAMQTKGP